jgi:hypothetical protein
MSKTRILIDPAHSGWVLGGLVREIAEERPDFFSPPKIVSNVRSIYLFYSIILVLKLNFLRSPILFSSITPMENFLKFSKFNLNKKILLFTHQDGEFSTKVLSVIHKSDLIFVFSLSDKRKLQELGIKIPIVSFMGAIKTELFQEISASRDKIAFIGTAVERKNPNIFLEFAASHPQNKFKILGKNWDKSHLWARMNSIKNIEYHEITSSVTSADLQDCSHHLMLSRTEGGPMTLIESVAAGLIPVCSETGIVREFLTEVGYPDQILKDPIEFDDISRKLKLSYSKHMVANAVKIAKQYSIKRMANTFASEIDLNLNKVLRGI